MTSVVHQGESCEVLLLRHAESEHNAARRVQGWVDSPLSSDGKAQAASAGERLRAALDAGTVGSFDAIVASDLIRAADTARIIAARLVPGGMPVEIDAGFREYHVGRWGGKTPEEIERYWPGELAAWQSRTLLAPPGGEERAAFALRARQALVRLVDRHPGGRVLLVSHGGLLRMVERRAGLPARRLDNLAGRTIYAASAGTYQAGARLDLGRSRQAPAADPLW